MMKSLIDHLKEEYGFLLNLGFEIENVADNGHLYAVMNLKNETGYIFCFTLEKGKISLAITTQAILSSKKFGPYDKYFDMFYLVKLLDSSIDFSEINEKLYPGIIKENIDTLISFFDEENIANTVKSINKITKDYNKVRWNNSKVS